MPLHPSMAAPDVVLLQSTRWDLHAWFVSKGMQTMGSWVDQPFVSDSMLREYEVDARAALFEVMHAFPLTKLWGLVISPPGVLSKAKSDAPFLQATLNARAQTAVKDVLKSAAADFGMVVVDWGGMIESAGQAVECEFWSGRCTLCIILLESSCALPFSFSCRFARRLSRQHRLFPAVHEHRLRRNSLPLRLQTHEY
jgi:hypothetical protein